MTYTRSLPKGSNAPSPNEVRQNRGGRILRRAGLTGILGLVLGAANIPARAATYFWDTNGSTAGFGTAGDTWGSSTDWSIDSTGASAPTVVTTATSDTLNFGTNSLGLAAGTITVGTVNSGDMLFGSASGAIVLSGGTITLAPTETTTINNATDTIGSVLTGASTTFTKAGTGTLILTGLNTFTGTVNVNAGTLQIAYGNNTSTGGGLRTTAGVTVNSGGTLSFGGADNSGYGFSGVGALPAITVNAGGTLTTAANTFSGHLPALILNGGLVTFASTSTSGDATTFGSFSLDGGVTAGGVATTSTMATPNMGLNQSGGTIFNVSAGATSGTDLLVSGFFGSAGSSSGLVKTGNGTMVLSGFNTYGGGTTVNGGTLILANGGGTGAIRGTLNINAGGTVNLASGDALGFNSGVSVTQVNIVGGTLNDSVNANNGFLASYALTGGTISSSGGGVFNINASGAGGLSIVSNASANTSAITASLAVRGSSTSLPITVADGAAPIDLLISGGISNDPFTGGSANGIIKGGGGTLQLTGTSTYTGATNVSAGTLLLGNGGGGSISSSSAVSVAASGTLALNEANGSTIGNAISNSGLISGVQGSGIMNNVSGAISGGGGVAQNGAGNTNLSGADTYTGTTQANAGTLTLSGSLGGTSVTVGALAGPATFAALGNSTIGTSGNGSLTLTGTTGIFTMVNGVTNTLIINNGTAGATVLSIGGSNSLTFEAGATSGDQISLGGGLMATASGNSLVNIVLLGRPSSNQTLTLINAPGGFTGSSNFTLGNVSGASTFGLSLALQSNSTQLNLVETTSGAPTTAYFLGNQGTSWSANNGTVGNFSTDSAGATPVTSLPGSITNVHFYATNANTGNAATSTLDGNFTINSLTVDGAALGETGSVGIASGSAGALTIAPASASTGIIVNSGAGGVTISAPLVIGAPQTWTNNSSNTLTVSGSINTSANALAIGGAGNTLVSGNAFGSGSLTQNGPGLLTITGNNSYSGGTTISSGTLQVGTGGASGSLPSSGGITDNGVLVFNRSNTVSEGVDFSAIGGTGRVIQNGAGTLVLGAANSYSGGTMVNNSSVAAGNSNGFGTGSLVLNSSTLGATATVNIPNTINVSGVNVIGQTTPQTVTLSGPLTGAGTLKNFIGTSSAANVFFLGDLSGFTGTIDYTDQSGATTEWWRVGANGTTTNLSNASLILEQGNVTDVTASSKNFGFTDGITGATLEVGALSGSGVFQSSFNNSGPNTLAVGYLNTNTVFAGALSGGGAGTNMALTKVGTGTLALTGSNFYTGTTTVAGGVLQIGNGGSTGSLAAGSAIVDNSTLDFDRSDTVTQGSQFSSSISGSGGLTQDGSGKLVLNSANNSYTGPTTVNGGTIQLSAAGTAGNAAGGTIVSGQLNVNTGGTILLGANHAIGTNTAVNLNGGTLNANGFSDGLSNGASTPTTGLGALTLSGNSTIDFGIGSTSSTLAFADSSSNIWNTNSTLTIIDWNGTPGSQDAPSGLDALFFGTSNDLTSQQLSQIVFNIGGSNYAASQAANGEVFAVAAVPEPSTLIGGLAIVALVACREKSRRLKK